MTEQMRGAFIPTCQKCGARLFRSTRDTWQCPRASMNLCSGPSFTGEAVVQEAD